MDLDEASRTGLWQGGDAARPAGRGRAWAWIALAAAIAAVSLPAAAVAVPEPGTPVAVAPGVPGGGRAWELVTPADTVTATFVAFKRALSPSGDKFVTIIIGTLPDAQAGTVLSLVLAERGARGWTATPLEFPDPASLGVFDFIFLGPHAFSPDFSESIWTSRLPPEPGEREGQIGLYRSQAPGQYSFLTKLDRRGSFLGASEDLQRVVFTSSGHLLPADAGRSEGRSIYELVGSTLRIVDVDDDGSLLSTCGALLPQGPGAISRDAKRIFLTSPACSEEASRVYLREGDETTEISASRCSRPDCDAEQRVAFVGATPDGASAFLFTAQQLTNDDVDSVPDLYRYDVSGGALSRVSSPRSPGFSGFGATEEAVQVAEDGSRVYFKFTGRLLPGLGDGESPNLYLADGSGVHYVSPPASVANIWWPQSRSLAI